MSAQEYGESRHPDFNLEINLAKEAGDSEAIAELADHWFSVDDPRTVTSWDKVAARLYSAARELRSDHLRSRAVEHIAAFPRLHNAAFRYLLDYELTEDQLKGLLAISGRPRTTIETRIEIARFLCDARLACNAESLVNSAVGEILADDDRLGSGYAKSLFLLCLNKYGSRRERDRIKQWASVARLQDEQLRLHYFYVFYCRDELDEALERSLRHLDTPDIALMMRFCREAKKGELRNHKSCLYLCLKRSRGIRSVEGRYLPFLHVALQAIPPRQVNLRWLEWALTERISRHQRSGNFSFP